MTGPRDVALFPAEAPEPPLEAALRAAGVPVPEPMTDFRRGERVVCAHLGAGTFLGYLDYGACPNTHLSYPGMRLCMVKLDRWGCVARWEKDVTR